MNRERLCSLPKRDAAVERWLRTEVVPALDKLDKHPESGISADEVFRRIRARHAEREQET